MPTNAKALALAATGALRKTAAQTRGEALLDLIARRRARIAEDFYDIGEALREILRKKLFLALGHSSFGALLDARKVMGRSQAAKLIAIVDAMPRRRALEVGTEKAYALTRLAAATAALDTVEQIATEGVAVGPKKRRSVEDLSAEDVKRLAKTLAKPKSLSLAQRADAAQVRAAQASLRRAGWREARVDVVAGGVVRVALRRQDLDLAVRCLVRAGR